MNRSERRRARRRSYRNKSQQRKLDETNQELTAVRWRLGLVNAERDRAKEELDTLQKVVRSRIGSFTIEGARHEAVDEIVRRAINAMRIATNEMPDSGDITLEITVPELHYARRIYRREIQDEIPLPSDTLPEAAQTCVIRVGKRTKPWQPHAYRDGF